MGRSHTKTERKNTRRQRERALARMSEGARKAIQDGRLYFGEGKP